MEEAEEALRLAVVPHTASASVERTRIPLHTAHNDVPRSAEGVSVLVEVRKDMSHRAHFEAPWTVVVHSKASDCARTETVRTAALPHTAPVSVELVVESDKADMAHFEALRIVEAAAVSVEGSVEARKADMADIEEPEVDMTCSEQPCTAVVPRIAAASIEPSVEVSAAHSKAVDRACTETVRTAALPRTATVSVEPVVEPDKADMAHFEAPAVGISGNWSRQRAGDAARGVGHEDSCK